MIYGKKTRNHGLVSCDHGLYFVPRFLVSNSGKVNIIARIALNILGSSITKGFKQDSLPVSFMPGMNCNLCCDYCYQRTSADSPLKKPHFKPIDNYPTPLVKFITKQAAKLNFDNVSVCLLGGEPLLYTEHLFKFLSELQKSIRIEDVSLITNGTLLTQDNLSKFKEFGLSTIQFTFDGGRQEHDTSRIYPNGNGSYDQVITSLQLALANGIHAIARINITANNINSIDNLLLELSNLTHQDLLSVYFEFVHDTDYYTSQSSVFDEYFEKYLDLIRLTKKIGFRMGFPTHNGLCPTCGDATNPKGVVLTSDGSLYSCFDSAGQKGLEVGDCQHDYYLNRTQNWVRCGKLINPETRHKFILETFATYLDS